MASGDGHAGRAPQFDGTNFTFWKRRMKFYLGSLGYDVWEAVLQEPTATSASSIDPEEGKKYVSNKKALNAITSALSDTKMAKLMTCTSAKQMWDKLISIQDASRRLNFVNAIRSMGETLIEDVVVAKVLRSMLPSFDSKVSALEESKDLDIVTLDEIHGALNAYEMMTGKGKGKAVDKEVAFKAFKRLAIKKKSDEEMSCEDEAKANFVRKLLRSTGKYKGKLPLNCFDCGVIGHFASKCPNRRKKFDEEEDEPKKKKRYQKKEFTSLKYRLKKRSLITKRDSDSSDTDLDEDSDGAYSQDLFMAYQDKGIEKQVTKKEDKFDDDDLLEAELNLEVELMSALDDLDDERRKNKKLTKLLNISNEQIKSLIEKSEEDLKFTIELETKLSLKEVECKVLTEGIYGLRAQMEGQAQEMNEYINTEEELIELRRKVESLKHSCDSTATVNGNAAQPQAPASMVIDQILRVQRPTGVRHGLGYELVGTSRHGQNKEK
ncbi:uncharacterized protein LOC122652439 [Telopea speciosissima]|uniref:uncharacterized protein LOC122652439 n=1 Tax=Telopea speciosissima TaxID=54955 RepID=UPI001CC77A33|nr:uncharacterized protein LOC122652439 [Telopea speciosissima]